MAEEIIKPGKEFKARRKKTKIREKVSDISFGAMNKLCEFVLFLTVFTGRSMKITGWAPDLARDLARPYPTIDIKQWLEGIHNAKRKKWLDANSVITKEGIARLQGLFPAVYSKKHWDGNWCVVNFDIPESFKRKRDVLREKLHLLGFGMLQKSVWIAPINFLGTVQKESEALGTTSFVLCSLTQNLGEEDSKILSNRVWRIENLNAEYKKFIEQIEKGIKKEDFPNVFFKYVSILRKDPQLPIELLPADWYGGEAFDLIKNFYVRGKLENKLDYFFFPK